MTNEELIKKFENIISGILDEKKKGIDMYYEIDIFKEILKSVSIPVSMFKFKNRSHYIVKYIEDAMMKNNGVVKGLLIDKSIEPHMESIMEELKQHGNVAYLSSDMKGDTYLRVNIAQESTWNSMSEDEKFVRIAMQ